MHKHITGVSKEVMEIFKIYAWPGNVREFRNIIEGAFNLCDDSVIDVGSLPSYLLSEFDLTRSDPEDEDKSVEVQWTGSLKRYHGRLRKKLILHAIDSHKKPYSSSRVSGYHQTIFESKAAKV